MRKALGCPLVFIIFLALSMGVFIQVHGEEVSPLVQVRHEVEVREGGLMTINDMFTLSTPPNVTSIDIANFFIGFPSNFIDHMDYHAFYQCNANDWIALAALEEEANGTRGFRVTLPNAVRLEGDKTLILRGVFLFSEVVHPYSQWMRAFFPLYPSLPVNISFCGVEVRLPKGAVLTSVYPKVFSNTSIGEAYILSHNQSSLPPFQMAGAALTYSAGTSSNLIVRCENLQRTIDLTSLSRIRILDTYTLLNLGPSLTSYPAKIPLNSFDINARDYLERLIFMSRVENEGYINLDVLPMRSIGTGEGWIFTVEYSLPFNAYVDGSAGSEFHLNYFFLSNFSFTVRHLEVTVILPEGGEYRSSTPASITVRKVGPFTQEVCYRMENATVLDDLGFHLAYTYNPLWTTFRPTLWASLLVLVGVGTYQLLRSRKPREREVSEGRLSLRRFIELHEEKLALSAEEEKLEESMDERRISRSEFNRRKETLDSRMANVESSLRSVKDRIRQQAPQFEKTLREIDAAEAEVKTERTNLRELETRLRGRSISRGAYRRLRQEYLSRIRRARSRIERVILSLREEAY